LQLFAHPKNSEWFSVTSVIIFEVNIVDEQKQAHLVTVYGKRSFLRKESDTLRSYRVYISPTM